MTETIFSLYGMPAVLLVFPKMNTTFSHVEMKFLHMTRQEHNYPVVPCD